MREKKNSKNSFQQPLPEVIIKYLLLEDLLHATYCAKTFTAIISFNSHNNLDAIGTVIILRKLDSGKFSKYPMFWLSRNSGE